MTEQGNIVMRQTADDGTVEITGGLFAADGGLDTMAYLCLFGGNEADDGRAENPHRWWGNLSETQPGRWYTSRTEELLTRLPAIPANLPRLQDAAEKDLETFIADGIASSVSVTATIPALNSVKLTVRIEAGGDPTEFAFIENWRANA